MFSLIIPLYNKAPYIQRAIDSVLNQSFSEYEVIVVNDGSTDGGEELVKEKYGDQVILINQTNQGVSAARNKGIAHSRFEFLAFLDADDFWHSDFLDCISHVIEKYTEIKMIGTSYSNDSLHSKIEALEVELIEDYFALADYNTLFTSSSTVIHKSFFENNTAFKSHLVRGEDIDIWLRAFDFFGRAVYIQAPLMFYDLKASTSHVFSPKLEQTIFSEIYRDDYELSERFPSWKIFRDKYLMLNLIFFFDQKQNFELGKVLLSNRQNDYYLSVIPYRLPYPVINWIISNCWIKSLLRKYLKFCFRYIYS